MAFMNDYYWLLFLISIPLVSILYLLCPDNIYTACFEHENKKKTSKEIGKLKRDIQKDALAKLIEDIFLEVSDSKDQEKMKYKEISHQLSNQFFDQLG